MNPALLMSLFAPESAACGGLFCDTTPVVQSAERVVFAVDETAQKVEMHVQITYQGSAPEFAWVVPVSGVPELFVSTDTLFNVLAAATIPSFVLNYEADGACTGDAYWQQFGGGDSDADSDSDSDSDADADADGGVVVVDQRRVGPYETVTLQADSAELLVDWLQENQYVIPDNLTSALAPYVAADQMFVALRLANRSDAGDIKPLGLRYPGTKPAIPIQLTSVAAAPDMRLEVYLLGSRRYVPESYLHVQINEANIDWFRRGANYEAAITAAADEAGGRAFATDYAGPTSIVSPNLVAEYDLSPLDEMTSLADVVNFLDDLGIFFLYGQTILNDFVVVPVGWARNPTAWYFSVARGESTDVAIDGAAFRAELYGQQIEPLEHGEELLSRHNFLSRLHSSVSAVEMTVDPTFVFSDLGLQSNVHSATVLHTCGDGFEYSSAPRALILADGTRIALPPRVEDPGETYLTGGDFGPNASVVEQFSGDGEAMVVSDRRPEIADRIAQANRVISPEDTDAGTDTTDDPSEDPACGCATGSGGASAALVAAALVLARRRRR